MSTTRTLNLAELETATTATPTPHPTVSLLVAFDIGETFVFKSTQHSREAVAKEWGDLFEVNPHGKDWCTTQWEYFNKPMGWLATWRYFGGTAKPELHSAIEDLRNSVPGVLDEDPDTIRAIVFTNGMGVLIIRVRATPGAKLDTLDQKLKEEEAKEKRREACSTIISWAAKCYLAYMHNARPLLNNGAKAVAPVHSIERRQNSKRSVFTYPIFLFNKPDGTEHFSDGANPPPLTYEGTKLVVSWGKCIAQQPEGTNNRLNLERNFTIGLASWFALIVMTERSTLYIRDAIHALATKKPHPNLTNARVIRLAYTEAANQALPIQWTSRESDLVLLEAIHDCWVSERWWRIVEQKTNLLAAHWEQQLGDWNENWNRRIAAFGATIACFTLISAVADLIGLIVNPPAIEASSSGPIETWLIDARVWLGFVLPLALGVIFVWAVLRGMSRREAPTDGHRERIDLASNPAP